MSPVENHLPGSARNRLAIGRFVLTLVLCFFLASFAPSELFAVYVNLMMLIAAAVTGGAAALARERFGSGPLNRWDVALGYVAVAMLAALFLGPPPPPAG